MADLLDATPLTNDSIALSWSPVAAAAEYRIYSDMGSGYGVYIYRARSSQPAFVDKMLRAGMSYSYRVTQLVEGREMALAQVDTATFADKRGVAYLFEGLPTTARIAPEPTALASDAVLLGLVSDNNYTDDFDTLTIAGEVCNDSNQTVGHTNIAVTFYDAAGAVIGTTNGKTLLEALPPGEVSPFVITLSRPVGLASYSLRAVGRPVEPELKAQLEVTEVRRYEDEAGFFHVKGTVENVGTLISKRTRVAAVIYGRDGRVINVGFTYVKPPTLAPGAQAAYDVIFAYYPRYLTQRVIPFEE